MMVFTNNFNLNNSDRIYFVYLCLPYRHGWPFLLLNTSVPLCVHSYCINDRNIQAEIVYHRPVQTYNLATNISIYYLTWPSGDMCIYLLFWVMCVYLFCSDSILASGQISYMYIFSSCREDIDFRADIFCYISVYNRSGTQQFECDCSILVPTSGNEIKF